MTHQTHPGDPAELAVLYASGAMTGDERHEFEAHLVTGCPQCRAALTEYDEVVASLAEAIKPEMPPSEVRASLMVRISSIHSDEAPWESSPTSKPQGPARHLVGGLLVRKASDGDWVETGHAGVQIRKLYIDNERRQFTSLVRMAATSSYPAHSHDRAEECLVLEGDLRFGDQVLSRGDFLRTGPGYEQVMQTTEHGCLLYLTTPFE